MPIHRFVVSPKKTDPRSEGYARDARALGFKNIRQVQCHDLFFIESQLSQEELQQLALSLLTDTVTQTVTWDEIPAALSLSKDDSVIRRYR